jgi:putative ATP-binding cassette transporter
MILKRFLHRYHRPLAGAVLLSCASAASTVALLAQINKLASGGALAHDVRQLLLGVVWLIAMLISNAMSQWLLARLGGGLVAQLRMELSRRFIDLEYEKLADRKHAVFGSLIDDVAHIAPLALVAPLLAYNVLLAVLYAGYLISVSAPLLGILLAFLCATFAASFVLARTMRTRFDALRQADEKVFEYFRFISDGKKEMTLNAARADHFMRELMSPAIARAHRLMVRVHAGLGLNEAWSSAVMYGALLVVVYLGYALLALSQDTIIHFVIGAVFLAGPMNFIVSTGRQVSIGTASLRHLERAGLNLGVVPGDLDAAQTPPVNGWRNIHLHEICYRYPGHTASKPTLGPLSLSFTRGEMVFIIGGNGSGKSTLLLLLSSLLKPQMGSIRIDDRPVQANERWYRERFTGVFGDFFLFPHVLDATGKPLPDDAIEQFLAVLGLGAQVDVTDGELSRLALSTGQRKRLALLQCYAEDREIFFFDEWAADQDIHFRDHFYCKILPDLKRRNKTIIAISHDDRYFHLADRVIALEAGRVVSDRRLAQASAARIAPTA